MHLLIEYVPIIIFLVAYFYSGIFFATKALMVAMPLGFSIQWLITKKINKIYLGSTILILILGGATLFFRNPIFLYWKPTALNWLIALIFYGSHWVGKKTIIQRMLAHAISLTDSQWKKLSFSWIGFFLFSGAVNIYVAYNFSEEFWVKFKLFGLFGITLIFVIIQSIWINKLTVENKH
jgi:intracellular septation protein